jgi:uncharacterized protein (DUF2267 family)
MVEEKENTDRDTATHHARSVMEVLKLAISKDEIEDLKAQMPEEFYEILNVNHQ